MSITLDADVYLLCSLFNINSRKLSTQYSGMTVEEIMEAEAAQGNTAAAKYDKTILSDPVKLIQLFQLQDPGNKYAILSNMSDRDLEELLPLLKPQDLVIGLNFFTKEKLLKMMKELPIEQLVKMTFEMFSPEQVIQYMPDDELNKVLLSTDMDKKLEIKCLQTLKPEILAQMIEAATGMPAPGSENVGLDGKPHFDGELLAAQIALLPDDKFKEAMISIPPQNKRDFILKLTEEDPKIFLLFSAEGYTKIINDKKEKEDIVRSSIVLEPEYLVKMLEKLPQDLTAIVLTQIDTDKFANVLMANFKNILKEIIAA